MDMTEGTGWDDLTGDHWVCVQASPGFRYCWSRLRDGAGLEATQGSVDFTWGSLENHSQIHTDDPQTWLTEHMGAPDLGMEEMTFSLSDKRAERLRETFLNGWAQMWRESHPGEERYSYAYWGSRAPYPDGKAWRSRSLEA